MNSPILSMPGLGELVTLDPFGTNSFVIFFLSFDGLLVLLLRFLPWAGFTFIYSEPRTFN